MIKLVVLHGQNHKGSTYNISKILVDKIGYDKAEVEEFYFAKNSPCIGCYQCFMEGEENCTHYSEVNHIIEAIENSDVVILESPCYCMGITGQLKSFLDHMGYRWMPHRPHGKMFNKIGIAISTAAGGGAKKVTKDLKQQMSFWGISHLYGYYINVRASSWDEVSDKKIKSIEKSTTKLALKIKGKAGKVKPNLKTKFLFYIMRINQKNNTWSKSDKKHWQDNGWLNGKKPW